ncbi:hypothetical protein C9426_10565 [Serratia sp. S1B]|nr:hypothetical protein C9426_10565 [Serratia sp. S1B]
MSHVLTISIFVTHPISEVLPLLAIPWVIYTRHTSRCMCVGFPRSPQSLTRVSSWGLMNLFHEVHPSGQRKRCLNRFLTDLSLRCRVTRQKASP